MEKITGFINMTKEGVTLCYNKEPSSFISWELIEELNKLRQGIEPTKDVRLGPVLNDPRNDPYSPHCNWVTVNDVPFFAEPDKLRNELGIPPQYLGKPSSPAEPKVSDEEIKLKDKILEEYKKGNVVVATFEGIQTMPMKDFLEQPIDGMLYDLNRNETTILTFLNDRKWVNDYALTMVIRDLVRKNSLLHPEKEREELISFAEYVWTHETGKSTTRDGLNQKLDEYLKGRS